MSVPLTPSVNAETNAQPVDGAPMVEWALWNAARGFRVFPLKAGTKDKPTIRKLSLATRDEAQIRTWWSRPGHEDDSPAGFLPDHVVIDLDARNKKTGAENNWKPSAKLLKITKGAIESAMQVRTRNGAHFYWKRPAGVEILSANEVERFVDVRAAKGQGYLVLPGAKVAYIDGDGTESLYRYKITHLPDEIGELPAPIAEAILARQKPKKQRCEVGAIAPGAEIDSDVALALAREAAAAWPPSVEGAGGHDNLCMLVAHLGDLGVTSGACLDVLLDEGGWNDRCAPPWAPEELEYQVQTMFQSRTSPIGCRGPSVEFAGVCIDPPEPTATIVARSTSLRVLDLDEVARMPRRECTVEGLLAPRDLFAIFGQPGSGKSLLAPYLALRIARGEPAFGRRVRQARVLYLACEDEIGMGDRLLALRQSIGGSDSLRLVAGCTGVLVDPKGPNMVELLRLIKDWKPGVISSIRWQWPRPAWTRTRLKTWAR